MGAVPESFGYTLRTSPANELDSRTEGVRAHTEKPGPRRFTRVPTHAIGVAKERRRYPRASLCLPLRLTRVAETAEPIPVTLVTRNISSSGIYFLAPRELDPGTAIELEVALVERPLGCGTVQMCTAAHIIRSDETETPGWRGYAASFDDFALKRDDVIPLRYNVA
jgi:PilZ domain